jgi:hypothetical protein
VTAERTSRTRPLVSGPEAHRAGAQPAGRGRGGLKRAHATPCSARRRHTLRTTRPARDFRLPLRKTESAEVATVRSSAVPARNRRSPASTGCSPLANLGSQPVLAKRPRAAPKRGRLSVAPHVLARTRRRRKAGVLDRPSRRPAGRRGCGLAAGEREVLRVPGSETCIHVAACLRPPDDAPPRDANPLAVAFLGAFLATSTITRRSR